MPTRLDGRDPDGRPRFVRTYDREELTVPPGAIAQIRDGSEGYGSNLLLADGRDGPFDCFEEFYCFARDGKRWVVLRNWMDGYAIEVELTDDRLGEILPLPPEVAWRIARALDDDHIRAEGPEPD